MKRLLLAAVALAAATACSDSPPLAPDASVETSIRGTRDPEVVRVPGGVALRFARVKGYRPDKSASEADTIDAVRAFLPDTT